MSAATESAAIDGICVEVSVSIGEVEMTLGDVLDLQRGTVIPLGRKASDLLRVEANGIRIGSARARLRGEKVVAVMDGGTAHQPF